MAKRILFTGGSGKAGRHVVPYLLDRGHEVINVDLQPLDHPGVHTLIADVADGGQVFNALTSHLNMAGFEKPGDRRPPDAVVHFAAIARNMIKPDAETFRVNVMSTYHVIEAATTLGVRKIIIASSETTYGVCFADGDKDYAHFPLDEDYDVDPMDSYGLSKVINERTAHAFALRTGADIYALRIGNVIEPHEYDRFPGFLADPPSRKRNAWSYIDARDLGQIVHLAVEADGLGFQIFNAVNDTITASLPTTEFLACYSPGVPITRPLDEFEAPISNRKIREVLGFREEHNWRKYVKSSPTPQKDLDNPQTGNAGNGGDLVKHTVYLTVLDYLLGQPEWANGLKVRECHAGRGLYRIPVGDARRRLLACLFKPEDGEAGVLLHEAQRASQRSLGSWPPNTSEEWQYSGSVVLNAWRLRASGGRHLLELYEQTTDTRKILRTVLDDFAAGQTGLEISLLEPADGGFDGDGERYIRNHIASWNSQDLILLDPFALWRQHDSQVRRDIYGEIVDSLGRDNAPLLVLFWTWGNAFAAATGDIDGTNTPVRNGYADLKKKLKDAGQQFVLIKWRWQLQFAMWCVVPNAHVRELSTELDARCAELRDHLQRNGYHWEKPDITVTVEPNLDIP